MDLTKEIAKPNIQKVSWLILVCSHKILMSHKGQDMLYGCEDVKAFKWMAGSDIIWMKRKYGLSKGCFQNEWNFKVEILAWEARGVHISASIAMAEAIDRAGGSNRQLPQTSPFYSDLFTEATFSQMFQTMTAFQPRDFTCSKAQIGGFDACLHHTTWQRQSRNIVAPCPTTNC